LQCPHLILGALRTLELLNLSTSLDRLTAALADRYTVEHEIGVGGMATVYLAHDLKHERQVALKVMRPELSAILGGERFLREVSIAAKLNHPHILALHDSGEAEAISITKQVGAAHDYAHEQGVIHRDFKPENILLHDGRPMVADVGHSALASPVPAPG
jgi:serine/threonine-protein kinase